MKKILVVCMALVGVAVAGSALAGAKAAKKEPVLWGASELKWETMPNTKVSTAALFGDSKKEAYGAVVKFPAGHVEPLHTHSNDATGIILTGTFTIKIDGGAEKALTAGSYFFVPGGTKHTGTCGAEADCTFFVDQPGKFDVTPVEMKKAEAPKQ